MIALPTTVRARRSSAACLGLALLFLAPSLARAQDDEPARRAAAQALFDRASALVDQHDYRAACPKLEEVTRLQPGKVGSMMALGECYEGAGRVASAWTQYRAAADRAAALHDARAATARAKSDALAPRVPRLRVQVGAATRELAGLEVRRDGIAVGAAQWGEPIPVDPGEHVIEAQAPGHAPLRVVLQIAEAETRDAAVGPMPPSPGAAAPPSEPPPPPVTAPAGSSRGTVGSIVGGVGVAGLGAGGVLGVVSLVKSHSADGTSACTGPATLANVNDCNALRDPARRLQTGGILAAAVGGAALVTGLVLVVTAPRADQRAGSLTVTLHAAGASLAGRF